MRRSAALLIPLGWPISEGGIRSLKIMSAALIGALSISLLGGSADIQPPSGATPGFGSSIDASGSHLIIGTSTGNGGKGHVAIYDQADTATPVWTLDVAGFGSDAAAGTAVAIEGPWAVVGIPGDNKVVILHFDSDAPTPQWTEHEWLFPPPGITEFGYSIDLNGNEMLIGAPGGDEGVGAWVLEDYTFPDGSTQVLWNSYGFIGTPLPPGSRWGHSVTIESSIGFVGSPNDNNGSGRIHLVYLSGGWIDIGYDLTTEIPWTSGQIGWDVMCRNGQLYVSAPSYGLNEASGIVWVLRNLEQEDGSFAWALNNYLTPPSDVLLSQFGYSIFTNASRVGISAPQADGKGAVFIYDCSVKDPLFPNFPYLGKSSPASLTNDSEYGTGLFIGANDIIAGAPGSDVYGDDSGRVLIDNLDSIEPPSNFQVPYDNSTPLLAFEGFAPSSITSSGSRVVLGIPHVNSGQGIVQLIENQKGSWNIDGVLMNDKASSANLYGHDVSQHENILAVGAPGTNGSGAVYIYKQSGQGYGFEAKLFAPRASNTAFGYSVDVYRDEEGRAYVAVGGPGINLDTGQITNPGHCYVYRADASDYSSWSLILSCISHEPKSLLGIDVDIEQMDNGLVMAAGEPSFLDGKGSVRMFSGSDTAESWSELPSLSGEVAGSQLGYSIGLKGRYLVTGAPGSTVNAPQGAAYVVALVDGGLSEWHVLTPAAGDTLDSFGQSVSITQDEEFYRVAASITGFNGGPNSSGVWSGSAADVFMGQIVEGGYINSLDYQCRAVNPEVTHGLGSKVAFHDSSLFMINNRQDAQALGSVAKGVSVYEGAQTCYWMAGDGGDTNQDSNWSRTPQDGDTLVFSLLGTTRYLVNMVGIVNGRLEFLYDKAILIVQEEAAKLKSIMVGSNAAVESASIIIGGGLVEVEEAVQIGGDAQDMAGSLYLAVDGRLDCDTITQSSTGQMGYGISSMTSPSQWVIDTNNIEINGSLRVQILAALADTLTVKDSFHFIRSSTLPPESQNRFDVIVLPALPNGLAMLPKYTEESGVRAGTTGWTLSLVVVSVDDLLAFNDPSSVIVDDNAIAIEVVDLTGDGAEEICLIFDGSPGTLVIFENDGAGGITQQVIVNTGNTPVDITSGDFDGDGTFDLAVANSADENVRIYYNEDSDITNGFTTLDVAIARTPTCLAGIDYNSDSLRDLVIGVTDDDADGNGDWLFYEATIAMRAGGFNPGGGIATNGTPLGVDPSEEEDQKEGLPFSGRKSNGRADVARFTGATNLTPVIELDEYIVGADPAGIVNTDLNGDGLMDVAVTSRTNGTIAILIQDVASPGDFLGPTYIAIGTDPMQMTAIDFNLDGNNDLAAITTDDDGFRVVRVLQNNGNLTFTSIDVGKGESPILVDSGDIDGNGSRELVTIGDSAALRSGGTEPLMSVREAESNCNCDGDANCDLNVNIDDLLGILAEYGCVSRCSYDINQDGVTDVDDILIVIGNWGPCSS